MNPKVQTIKMYGPSISDPTKTVNRDIAVCDEQAYKAAGYQRGSIPEASEALPEPQLIETHTEEVSLEEPEEVPAVETPVEKPAKSRRKKGQN